MRQCFRVRNAARRKVPSQKSPRFKLRGKPRGAIRNVKQNRFAPFLNGETTKPGRVCAG
jgi:hypothetical protein